MEREKIEAIVESLLLVAGEPLTVKRLADLIAEADKKEVQAAVNELARRLEAAERGLRVVEVAGGYQLQTAPENAVWVGKLLQQKPMRLSRPALECLAIVAYKQPVTRAEVEEVRGVDSGGVIKTLLEHGFLKIAGRKDVAGKPLIYSTDKKFLEFFRLKSLAELPTLKDLPELQETLPFERPIGPDPAAPDPGLEPPGEDTLGTEGEEPAEPRDETGTDEPIDSPPDEDEDPEADR